MDCEANLSSEEVTGKIWKGNGAENKLVSFPARPPFSIHSKDLILELHYTDGTSE